MMESENALPAVLLGGGITALGAARSLGRAGIPVLCADNPGELVHASRFARPLTGLREVSMSAGDLLRLLESRLPQGAVLIPCSDPWALVVAELMSGGGLERYHASTSSPEVIQTLIDKDGLRELLERLSIAHPLTERADAATDLESLLGRFPSGAFLKPADSAQFFERYKVKALHFSHAEEALAILKDCAAEGLEMLVQDYIPGPPTRQIFIGGFRSARDGAVRLLVRRRLRMYPPDFGNSTAMVTIPSQETSAAVDAITKLVKAVDYRGIFSAEFKEDPRDGAFRLLEVNTRAWWYVEYAARCGLPTPLFAYLDALGRSLPDFTSYSVGRLGSYPQTDFDGWRYASSRRCGDLLARAWTWIRSIQPIWCLDDPRPGFVDFWRKLRGAIAWRMSSPRRHLGAE